MVHTSCLPGYFLRDGTCICEETNIVALCDPDKKGVILNVSCAVIPVNVLHVQCHNIMAYRVIFRMVCGELLLTGVVSL